MPFDSGDSWEEIRGNSSYQERGVISTRNLPEEARPGVFAPPNRL